MPDSDFVIFDHHNLTITVEFADKSALVIHPHDPQLSISHFAHGHGGQNVNKHQNGVRLLYSIPEAYRHPEATEHDIEVRCHEQRHQHQNLELAFKHLAEKLHDYFYVAPPRMQTQVPYHQKIERVQEKKHRGKKKELRKRIDNE